jgi:hypothetical protein
MKMKHIVMLGIIAVEACVLFSAFSFAIDVYINPTTNRCPTIQ